MREIKFREWEEETRSMTAWEIILDDGFESYLGSQTLMQYTGRKDVDGVEIYDNDILEFTYWWFDGNHTSSLLTGTIVYSDELMSFQLKGVKNKEWEHHTGYNGDTEYLTPFSELIFDEADFRVIGNIHENPELIKKGAKK